MSHRERRVDSNWLPNSHAAPGQQVMGLNVPVWEGKGLTSKGCLDCKLLRKLPLKCYYGANFRTPQSPIATWGHGIPRNDASQNVLPF